MKQKFKYFALITICVFILLFIIITAKDILHKYQISKFFDGYTDGKILFNSNGSRFSDEIYEIMSLIPDDRKFRKEPETQYKQELIKMQEFEKSANENLSPSDRYSIKYNKDDSVYYVIDKKTDKQIFKLKHWVVSEFAFNWSPNSRFIVYDYAYDRDDLSKIFVADIKTGQTILLSEGANPIWVK